MRRLFLCALAQVMALAAFSQVNVQLHYDLGSATNPNSEANRQKVTTTVEMFKADHLGSTYFFIDMDYRSKTDAATTRGVLGAYWEVSRDFTFAKVRDTAHSFTAHAEYNGGLNVVGPFQQALLVGPAWQWHSGDFSKTFTLQAMYKQFLKGNGLDPVAGAQFTAVWGVTFANRFCTFAGFADLWYGPKANSASNGMVFLTEPQFWVNLNAIKGWEKVNLSIGTEWEISNNFVWRTAKDRTCFWNPTVALKWTI